MLRKANQSTQNEVGLKTKIKKKKKKERERKDLGTGTCALRKDL